MESGNTRSIGRVHRYISFSVSLFLTGWPVGSSKKTPNVYKKRPIHASRPELSKADFTRKMGQKYCLQRLCKVIQTAINCPMWSHCSIATHCHHLSLEIELSLTHTWIQKTHPRVHPSTSLTHSISLLASSVPTFGEITIKSLFQIIP